MKLEDLCEAASKLGLVISYVNNKFEDINLVDWNTQQPVNSGHAGNLFKHLISLLRNIDIDDAFAKFAKFAKSELGKGVKLGEEYADQDENDSFIMYPVDVRELGTLGEKFLDEIGYKEETDNEDEYSKRGLKRSDFR